MTENESVKQDKPKSTPIERISNGVLYLVFCAAVFTLWQIIGGIVGSTYAGQAIYMGISVFFLIVWIVGTIIIAIKATHVKISDF